MIPKILNLTQHTGTPDQAGAGLQEPSPEQKKEILSLITFNEISDCSRKSILARANRLAQIALASGCSSAMIGGASYLQGTLEKELRFAGIVPVHAFTKRVGVEEPTPEGGVKKTFVFQFEGWVESAII